MKIPKGRYYVEVKDHRYIVHPTKNIILRERDPPKTFRTQYQDQNNTQIRRIQKVNRNNKNELLINIHPENKQPKIQQPKLEQLNCPSCKKNNCLEFDKGYYCRNCEYIINRNIR